MRKSAFVRLFAVFLAVFLIWGGQACAAASDTTSDAAKKIQLVETEGTVTVTDSSNNIVALNGSGETRLYSGFHIATGKDSVAWFSLDESKAVKLDASSDVEIRSHGRKLELLLNSGALYCNVSESVPENNTFEIRTSTTITGIRGTIVGVDIGRTREGKDTVTVFRGTVEVRLADPASENYPTIWISEGQSFSHSSNASEQEPEVPAPLNEVTEFFAESLEEDGITAPWPVKAPEEDAAEEPSAQMGKVSNLFVDGGGWSEGGDSFIDGGDPEPGQDTGSGQDPEPEQGSGSNYTVLWLNDDGTVLEKDESVADGSDPSYDGETPVKAATAQYTYTFSGWDKELAKVSGDVTYTAVYRETLNSYTVTFLNDDGTELQSGLVAYDEMPSYTGETPAKTATAKYTYTFSGWDKELAKVTEAVTYKAVYTETVNKYTVTFLNEDGTELQSSEVAYDEMPSYTGETPVKAATAQYTYTFSGWDKELAKVTEAVTYKAVYTETLNKYTVTFLNDDGTELQSSEVAYDEMPSYTGETPAKTATAKYTYTFSGWDKELAKVTEAVTYTAVYTETVNKYTVTFVNYDGTELQSGEVAYDEMPSYTGETPAKTATAQYTYTFSGWDKELAKVTEAVTYTAVYTETVNKYTVTFQNEDGTELQSSEVAYDEMPSYTGETPAKTATAKYTYTFSGWDKELAKVTEAVTYTAVYTETVNKYTVTFQNDDGTELQSSEVAYDEMPSYTGETPAKTATAKYTYTFSGWDKELAKVTEAVTYTAVYTETVNKYTVTFQNDDGTELQSSEVAYDEMPSYTGETPAKTATAQYTYTFSGWDKELAKVTEAVTYTAVYTETVNKYTVTFQNEDGTELQSSEVAYGEMPVCSESLPMVMKGNEPYAFSYWKVNDEATELEEVTGSITYTAVYEPAYHLTLHLNSLNDHFFGEMSDQYLAANGFTLGENEQGIPDERFVTKWCVKGKEVVLPDASAINMKEDTDGFFFLGWHDAGSDISESVVSTVGADNLDDREFYALYAVDEDHIGYNVEYDDNGGVSLSFGYFNADSTESMPNQIPAGGFTESPWGSLEDGAPNGKITYLSVEFKDILRPTSMAYWFSGLNGCDDITFYYLDTSLVTDMNHMFAGSTLYSVELGCFNTGSVTDMTGMFEGCSVLENIYVSKQFVVTGVPADSVLFSGCENLSGEKGTVFSSERVTAEYARIDGGEAAPGYFSQSELYYDG